MKTIKPCLALMAIAMGVFTSPLVAQEDDQKKPIQIEILTPDGEQVDGKIIAPKPPQPPKIGAIQAELKDGKVTIIDSQGKRQQLNVDGARSIIINKSFQSVDNNGQRTTKKSGTATVVGPDGKRHTIQLGDGDLGLGMLLGSGKGNEIFRINQRVGRFKIGLFCEPTTEALTSQLRIPRGAGLTVSKVIEGSAAEKAGIQKFDVIRFANDKELKNQADLTKVVEAAGKNKSAISLQLLRGGRETTADVTPVERSASELEAAKNAKIHVFPDFNGKMDFQFQEMGPGVLFKPGDLDMFQNRIRQRMEAQMKQMNDLQLKMDDMINRMPKDKR